MQSRMSLDDLRQLVGTELGVSEWVPMTQQKFDDFAELTGDADWIHNDPERCAKESPFEGKTIAQGHLLLSHMSHIGQTLMPEPGEALAFALNYGYERVRFIRPVLVGSRVRGGGELIKVENVKGGAVQATVRVTVEIEGSDRPACVIDTISRFVPAE